MARAPPAFRFPLHSDVGLLAQCVFAKRRLNRGAFRSVEELKRVIHDFIADTNADPRPFIWTKDPNKILAAVKRGHQALHSIH
jgi:hypothetical protein